MIAALTLLANLAASPAPSSAPEDTIAPGARVRVRTSRALSSNGTKTGEPFGFTLAAPLHTAAGETIPAGACGSGTVVLAGPAGANGHEGDLTLRLDRIALPDNRDVRFNNARFEVNGKNRKVAAAAFGFVPIVGAASFALRGEEARIPENAVVETVITDAATIVRRESTSTPEPATCAVPH